MAEMLPPPGFHHLHLNSLDPDAAIAFYVRHFPTSSKTTWAGLPATGAREVLEKRTFKDAVDRDWALSRQYGITGVPTFVAGHRGVVGAQPYEVIEQLVKQARAEEAGEDR